MIDKAIVSIMSVIIFLMIFINIMGMMLNVVQKIGFDQICRSSLFEMDLSGGLTEENRQILYTRLENAGYLNVSVQAPTEVQYGNWITLKVDACINTNSWNNLLQREEAVLYLSYDQKIISRKIHNMAY